MMQMKAREFLGFTREELWSLPLQDISLAFDDGEVIETTMEETIYSSYSWAIHKKYDKLPLLKTHHMSGRTLNKHLHLDLLNNALWDCVDIYADLGITVDIEHLCELVYIAFNDLHNDLTEECEAFVSSVSAIDIIECLDHPEIKAANDKIQNSLVRMHFTADQCNSAIKKVLRDPTQLLGNGISQIIQAGTVRDDQVLQCVGARGGVTDIDSNIFPRMIRRGFAHGFTTLWETMQESRSASKSLLFQTDPMQKSEYANRNLQLSSATLRRLHAGDCGSKDYLPITLDSSDIDARKKMLEAYSGFAYWDEETKTEKLLTPKDTHLLGKTLQFRTVFTCKHPDRSGVCQRCFGLIGQSIPKYDNLGHVSVVVLQGKITQLLMSNKHLDSNAKADLIVIPEHDRMFIQLGAQEQHLYLNPDLGKTKYRLVIKHDEAPNLSDIFTVSSVKQLVPTRSTALSFICIEMMDNSNDKVIVEVKQGQRLASFTYEMLHFLREKRWTRSVDGDYVIDMDGWDYEKPFVVLPLKHFSTLDYMLHINTFIRGGSTKKIPGIMSYKSPTAALMAFHDLVAKKLSVNASFLQAIILATMANDRDNRDYRLPLPRENGTPTRFHEQMMYRSLGKTMAHQHQGRIVFSTQSYLVTNRPDHPLDSMLMGGSRS